MVWAPQGAYLYEFLFFAVVLLATATVVRSHSRLVVITSLGVVGFGVAFVFVLFAAPDLAITQFLVDTLVVIIAALVLIRLPSSALRSEGGRDTRWLSGAIAIAGGLLVTGLLLAVTALPFDGALTQYFEANSYPAARGRNIVNVILVDFRAVDTLAEVVVLAVGGRWRRGAPSPPVARRRTGRTPQPPGASAMAARDEQPHPAHHHAADHRRAAADQRLPAAARARPAWRRFHRRAGRGGGRRPVRDRLRRDAAARLLRVRPGAAGRLGDGRDRRRGLLGMLAGREFLTGLWWVIAVGDQELKLSTAAAVRRRRLPGGRRRVLRFVLSLEER
jgi:multisubunit Na+/H+ antiporter MnhB subunit